MSTNGHAPPTLEQRIKSALENPAVSAAVVAELVTETEEAASMAAATAVSERAKASDLTTMAACDLDTAHLRIAKTQLFHSRLENALPRLRDKLTEALDREGRERWRSDRDRVERLRDEAAGRYCRLPDLISEIYALLVLGAQVDSEVHRVNLTAPPSERHLLGLEESVRGLSNGFSDLQPSWAATIKLPGDTNGRPCWPPYTPIDPGMIVRDTFYGPDWWRVIEEREARKCAEGQRADAYYSNQAREKEANENAAAARAVEEDRRARARR